MKNKFKLAVVGTNFIVPEFIDAAERSEYFVLHSIISRKLQSGADFKEANGYEKQVVIYDNFNEMLSNTQIDVVYLASPNAIHYSQAAACIKAGKTVIVEKPIASNTRELTSLIALARENKVLLLDGMKSLLCPNFNAIVEHLPRLGRIRQCTSTYAKVSSRYQQYLDGKNPNTFNPALSNGSVMDLGVYCLYPFVSLFGDPDRVHAFADLLESGVDAAGTVVLKYPDFHLTITHSKVSGSANSSEIQGELGTIVIDNISTMSGLWFVDNAGKRTDISVAQNANPLVYIAEHLGKAMSLGLTESSVNTHALSSRVMKILDKIRYQTGVRYPADDGHN